MIPVEGNRGLYRDESNNAIINCNKLEYDEYKRVKTKILEEKDEISRLKQEIEELKSILTQLTINNT